jgi:hypothetical protein
VGGRVERMTRLKPVLLALLSVAVVGAGCSGGDDGPSARLTVDGRVSVASGGSSFEEVDDRRTVRAGDRLRVDEGTATLSLGDDRQVELRKGSEVTLDPGRPGGAPIAPALSAGDALLSAAADPVEVGAGNVDVSVAGGSARLSRAPTVVVAAYSGRASVSSPAGSLEVPALRQVSVPEGGPLPPRPSPLSYQPADSWDQRLLGDAIELGDQLAARSRGFTAQAGSGQGRTPGFYKDILPALNDEPGFDVTQLGPNRDPGEALVGLAITVEGRRGTFDERVRSVFGFHDEGAAWGLVALDQGVTRAPLLASIDDAIGRGPRSVAEGGAPPTPPPAPPAPPPARRPTTTSPPAGPRGTVVAAPTTVPSPPNNNPSGDPGPLRTGVPAVDNTVNSLVELLSGLLGGLGN